MPTGSKYRFYIEREINWRWVMKVARGRILCSSQAFNTRDEALADLELLGRDLQESIGKEMSVR